MSGPLRQNVRIEPVGNPSVFGVDRVCKLIDVQFFSDPYIYKNTCALVPLFFLVPVRTMNR